MMLKNSMMQKGFTLVEMAIVLVIFGLLITALLLPLRAQREQAAQSQTISRLENAKQALMGFVQANGRLPCPATDVSSGIASPNASGLCTTQLGFLPAASLGVQPTDAQGFAVDAWDNRIMYAVTQSNQGGALTPDYTTNNDINDVGIVALSQNTENLRVCSSDVGVTATRCSGGTEGNFLINNAVAVIYSSGATGSLAPGSASEASNPTVATNPKVVFVSREISLSDAPNEFDHIVTWISPYGLYSAMIQAGQLH